MNSAHVLQAAQALKRIRPAYTDLLDFYAQVFAAQEDSQKHTCPEPIIIPPQILALKKQEKLPLINPSEFSVDIAASANMLNEICRISMTANETMASAAQRLSSAVEAGKFEVKAFFSMISGEKDEELENLALGLGIGKEILAVFGYYSISPSLKLCAEQLSTYMDKDGQWDKGCCPICGKSPVFSVLRDRGERFLICDHCRNEWQAKRIYCPFCENTDSNTLSYLYSDEEEEYRVCFCEQCCGYMKTLDIRKISRPVYLPLEQISTLHLDMIAKNRIEQTLSEIVSVSVD